MIKIVASLVVFSSILVAESASFDGFTSILARVESSNNPKAYKKSEKAVGIYQIRPDYFKDAKEFDKNLSNYTHNDCYNPKVSKLVVRAFMLRYEPKAYKENNYKVMAMAHNGGPSWRISNPKKRVKLDYYWGLFTKQSNQIINN
jgi:hypothetical protein